MWLCEIFNKKRCFRDFLDIKVYKNVFDWIKLRNEKICELKINCFLNLY